MVVLYAMVWFLRQLVCLIIFIAHWIIQSPFYSFYGVWSLIRKARRLPYLNLENSPVSGIVVSIEGLTLIGLYVIS